MTRLTDQQSKALVESVKRIEDALLGDPYNSDDIGLVKQVGRNTKQIAEIKTSTVKKVIAAAGVGVAGGGLGATKLGVLLTKLAAMLGL